MSESFFAMALHFHQPVGNFAHVIDRAYEKCYRPFVELLWQYPDIKMTFHFSGCLLDYFGAERKELLDTVVRMAERRQIEIMGGAYYEPILTAIPKRDLFGQIELMRKHVKSTFGCQPAGMWIPERVWSPGLAPLINEAGIKYCILDDTHFKKAGISGEDLYGYYSVGPGGKKIAVFPSDKRLRYGIPFKEPSEVIDYFKEAGLKRTNALFVYGDDGEKFGEWPGTHKWVYQDRWLAKFFDELMKNSGWLRLVTFSEYMDTHASLGETELPEASYDEMMEWADGPWNNFLIKYAESNQMHKKMCYVSGKVEEAGGKKLNKSDRRKIDNARTRLFKGQCNCAYWHGVFGGLYLYHLRNSIYSHLIEADKIADEVLHKSDARWTEIKSVDYDSDGENEVIMESPRYALYLDPQEGGALKELDYRKSAVNLINTLSRKKENYHKTMKAALETEESGASTIHKDAKAIDPSIKQARIVYDKYPRYCLRDYFIDKKLTRHSFMDAAFEDLGGFSNGVYSAEIKPKRALLKRRAEISGIEVSLSKEINMKPKHIEAAYSIQKEGSKEFKALLGVEFNITMPFLNSDRYSYLAGGKRLGGLDADGRIREASSFWIKDSEGDLDAGLEFSKSTKEIWYFPVRTISQSERAYELNYQCSSVFPIWELDFDKKGIWNLRINLVFNT